MSFNNQNSHISSGLSVDTTPTPIGFVYAPLSGTWTSSALGDNFLLTGTSSDALVELMSDYLSSGETPTAAAQNNFTAYPIFDYVYFDNKIAKVLQVISPTKILVNVDFAITSQTISATSSIMKSPCRVTFSTDTLADFLSIYFPDGSSYVTPSGTGQVIEKSVWVGFGTLQPFLAASNAGGGATVAIIEY